MLGSKSYSIALRFLGAGAALSITLLTLLIFRRPSYFGPDGSPPYILKNPVSTLTQLHQSSTSQTNGEVGGNDTQQSGWEFNVHRDGDKHGLSESECLLAFPKLFTELDRTAEFWASNGGITYEDVDDIARGGGVDGNGNGLVRAAIEDGELYIIDYGPQPYTFSRGKATLHSLHRALSSYADRYSLPDIEFVLTTDDFSARTSKRLSPIWSYTKRQEDEDAGIWLMPDFGFWSWPEVETVGEYKDVRRRISAMEEGIAFSDKKKQLLWRGSVSANPEIRKALLDAARGKSWANVKEISWDNSHFQPHSKSNPPDNDVLPIEDHCTYAFLAHTEGRSFSGRGKYLLNCNSVFIAHKLSWLEAHHSALISSGPDANYVEVERDWSDLERKVEFLLDNPQTAERIAENSVKTLRDRYLTPAAESCYWRALLRKYGEVSGFAPVLKEGRKGEKNRGSRFESWVLGF
ncbi:glycosyl transferase family 90-domain-containing protein [Aspergillus spinulosporus]